MKKPETYHTSENYDWQVSKHACERWCERIGKTSDTWSARILIQIALENSILIPNRYAVTRWVEKVVDSHTTLSRRSGIRYHLTGSAVIITGGNRVITIIKATEEDHATVLVWLAFGFWLEDEVQETPAPA